MKRMLAMLAALVISLTACASSGQPASGGSAEVGSEAATGEINPSVEETAEAVGISFWYAGGKTAVGVLAEIIEDFNKAQSAYHVSAVTQADYTETYTKLQAGIAGGNPPDLALLGVDALQSLASKGLLVELVALADADPGFDKGDYVETFTKSGELAAGGAYGIPAYGTTQVLYYNIELFDRAGIDPVSIRTWQDLGEAASLIAADGRDEGVYGWEPMWGAANLIDAALSNGGKVFSEDGKTVTFNSPEWVEVWEQFRDWIHGSETMRIHSGGQGWEYWYKTIEDVLLGKAGGYTGSSGDQADLDFSVVAALEQPGWGANPSAPTADALHLAVPLNTDQAKVNGSYEFIKFFTSPENQAKWSLGTGYVAVRKSTADVAEFKEYAANNPQILVPMNQVIHGTVLPVDPTGNAVYYTLATAADKVEIENIPAKEALDEAQAEAQAILDDFLGS
jgi:multiple sugar transport system substrate-binding protein